MMDIKTVLRVLWPDRGPLFLIGGTIVSLLGDFAAFLGNIASPALLVWPLVAVAALLAWLCFGRVGQLAPAGASDEAADAAVRCRECDVFRLVLFASVGAGLLLLAGQGTTATERIGAQLGLIQQDVTAIREDTAALRDISSSVELVRNPNSAQDWFHNAWIYANVRRDNENAWQAMRTLYQRYTPNKLDAAELYLNVGRTYETRANLLTEMQEIGRRRRDAAMLVIAGRNAESNEQALALYEEARAIDPDLPFAHWDVSRVQFFAIPPGASAQDNLRNMQANVSGHEAFLAVASRAPVARYFYVPQHQPDYEALARSQLDSFRSNAQTWERIVQQQAEIEARRRR